MHGYFEKAKEYFELSLQADENMKSYTVYADFLRDHNQIKEAFPFYQKGLDLGQKLVNEDPSIYNRRNLGRTSQNLGYVYYKWGDYETAQIYMHKAIANFDSIANEDPKYRKHLAAAYYFMGWVQIRLEYDEKAEYNFSNSLAIRQKLKKDNLDGVDEYLLRSLLILSRFYISRIENKNKSIYFAKQALGIAINNISDFDAETREAEEYLNYWEEESDNKN